MINKFYISENPLFVLPNSDHNVFCINVQGYFLMEKIEPSSCFQKISTGHEPNVVIIPITSQGYYHDTFINASWTLVKIQKRNVLQTLHCVVTQMYK